MRVIDPRQFNHLKPPRKSRKGLKLFSAVVAMVLFASTALGVHTYSRPIPSLQPHALVMKRPAKAVGLAWPTYGQAAIGTTGHGVLASGGASTPAPTASVSKVMLALAVVRQKPINVNEPGATLTLSQGDVALYHNYLTRNGSVVLVQAGEQLTQYQALQALLIASANNIADTLAVWAFGSVEGYLTYSNDLAKSMGLDHTHIADASGFSAQTVSTASDLVLLARAALDHPVIAQIVSQKEANLPVAGVIRSTNALLGQHGVIGIKTGNTAEAGGCYLFAAKHQAAGGYEVTIIGVIMGAPNPAKAINDAVPLLASAVSGFELRQVVAAGQQVGYYDVPWGERVPVVAKQAVRAFSWNGRALEATVSLGSVQVPTAKGAEVGTVKVSGEGSSPAVLQTAVSSPDNLWRIWRRRF